MPVLAHDSTELILDVFNEKIKISNVDKFCINNSIMIYNIEDSLYRFDLNNSETLSLILQNDSFYKLTQGIHEMKISKNGTKFGILLKNSDFLVFDNTQLLFEEKKVNSFELSNTFIGYETEKDLILKDFSSLNTIFQALYNYQNFFVFDNFCLLVTTKNKDTYKILKVTKNNNTEIGVFDSLVNVKCKSSLDENYILVNLSTSYVKNSYFASTILYLYDNHKGTFNRVNKLTNILDFVFNKNGFCVVYGNQPSYVTTFDYDCNILDKYPKGIRNRICFNHQESFVTMAGFDQLAGNVEVYDVETKEKYFTSNELGASKIEWDTSGSYYYVSTLKYLKEDNRVSKYDYYGRLISTEKFDCLNDVVVYGTPSKFEILKKPEEKIFEKKEEAYIPSILKGKSTFKVSPVIKSKPVVTEEEIERQLSDINILKERLERNEELEVEELNLILKEGLLKKKLKKYKK